MTLTTKRYRGDGQELELCARCVRRASTFTARGDGLEFATRPS